MVAETLDGHLIRDEVKGSVNLAPEDRVRGSQSVADDAGKVRLLVILWKEGEIRRVLVRIQEESHRQYQTGCLSDVTPVS